jgi:hypothetical protein
MTSCHDCQCPCSPRIGNVEASTHLSGLPVNQGLCAEAELVLLRSTKRGGILPINVVSHKYEHPKGPVQIWAFFIGALDCTHLFLHYWGRGPADSLATRSRLG